MPDKLTIVKIGGNVIDEPEQLKSFLLDFANLPGLKILVHGGGKLATGFSKRLGLEPRLVDGRRITSDADLEVAVMVYAGLINKSIVARLQASGCNALGLSGADGNSIVSQKRPVGEIDFGWVGDVKQVHARNIRLLLEAGFTPVFCALTHDGQGQMLNTNADTIAAELAIGLSGNFETELLYCFEKKGVLRDVEDADSVISTIDSASYARLKTEGVIHQGMLPKMENCFRALQGGVRKVLIGHPGLLANPQDVHTRLSL